MSLWDIITCIYGGEKKENIMKPSRSVEDCFGMLKSEKKLYDPKINYCGSCCHILEDDNLKNLQKYKRSGKLYYFCGNECHKGWLDSPEAMFVEHRLFTEKENKD